MKKILVISGDGIGPEVVAQAVRIINWFSDNVGFKVELDETLLGGIAYDKTGSPFPEETLNKAKASDAILLGAVGGPKWESLDYSVRPERGLLGIRKDLGLFANLRPAIVFDALIDASTLKADVIRGIDIMIIRELTGDLYFGEPRGVERMADGSLRGVNTMVYTSAEVERVARVAMDLARKRGRKVCSVDKANVLETTEMWRNVVQSVRDSEYTDVELSHMYVDNVAMQLIRNPRQFDVMLTGNIFGDILSDEASMLTGSLGMLPSASLGAVRENGKQYALYEPIHGSAPDIAGKGVANPLATILSVAMMFRYSFDQGQIAEVIENAVKNVLNQGIRTADIAAGGASVSTSRMGDAVLAEIEKNKASLKVAA